MLLPLGKALSNGSLAPRQQALVADGGEEEAPFLAVLEVGDHPIGQGPGFPQPARVAGGRVEPEQAVRQEGVILQVGGELGLALAIGPQQAAVGQAQLVEQEPGGRLGGLAVLLDLEDPVAVGVGGDHQAVPAGEDLVVAAAAPAACRGPPAAARAAVASRASSSSGVISSASACSAAVRGSWRTYRPPSKFGSPVRP